MITKFAGKYLVAYEDSGTVACIPTERVGEAGDDFEKFLEALDLHSIRSQLQGDATCMVVSCAEEISARSGLRLTLVLLEFFVFEVDEKENKLIQYGS